jgi:hypothetical protein
MKTKLTLILLCFITLFGCQITSTNNAHYSSSEEVNYFDSVLLKEKYSLNFEIDAEKGFIKIGNFLKKDQQNAIVVSLDSISSIKIYELKDDEWKLMYHQEDIDMSRVYEIKPYIEDYNFDGINDIGLKHEVSNGTSIMSFHLWLNQTDTFIDVPEFQTIGNPTIILNKKLIHGYTACCVWGDMRLTNYEWNGNELTKTEQLEISNYPSGSGIKAYITERDGITQREVEINEKDVNLIIEKFSDDWRIIDSTAQIGFTSKGVNFHY